MNKQQPPPFSLKTGGDCDFRAGDRGLGTQTSKISTMNKQQPYHLGWELGGTEVWGGDRGLGTYYNEQTTTL